MIYEDEEGRCGEACARKERVVDSKEHYVAALKKLRNT